MRRLCSLLTFVAMTLPAATQETAGVLLVTLRPRVAVDHTLVTLADVAELRGGSEAQRNRAGQLDLTLLSEKQPEAKLSREHVNYRLQLGGMRPEQFRVVGGLYAAVRFEKKVAEPEMLVKVRDRVRLMAKIGSFRVTALGEALQDGREGQTIRVRNIDSNKIVSGRVVEQRVVEVEY